MDVDCPAPDHVLSALLRAADGQSPPLAVLDPTWPRPLRADAESLLARAVDDGRLGRGDLVVFTSGSAGRPRGVVRTVSSWTASLAPLAGLTGIGRDDVVWLPGPLTSSLSLYGAFSAAAAGARVAPGDPTADVTAAHLVPTLLADACDLATDGGLPRLHTVVVAGAALPAALRSRARALGWRVLEYYGAAELSFVGWRDDDGPFRDFPGARVRLRDGLLWVDSPYLARGYLDPADPGPLRRDGAWATVGDAGRRVDGGWLVTGRAAGAVTTGGSTVLVEEVEAFVGALPGVREVAVAGWPHERLGEVVAAVVVPAEGGSPASTLRSACRELPAPARPRRWLTVPELPRTPAGKVDRAALARLLPGLAPLS
ncbi:MAG TPA: fatty acid--CoA ligase family protein [Actinomycetales bacterium]|nr:fatty acid--CoA ligase family protein [Actinomycetales bacterium]